MLRAGEDGADESFNDNFRDECLSLEWFRCRTDAVVAIEAWRRHYNDVRPHSSLGGLTPSELRRKGEAEPVRRAQRRHGAGQCWCEVMGSLTGF